MITGSPWHFSLSDFTWSLLQLISYSSGFSTPELVPARGLHFSVFALRKPRYPVFVSLLWEARICPAFSPFSQIQKELLIFQLCLFIVRLAWGLPSFLHVDKEGNQKYLNFLNKLMIKKRQSAELFSGSNNF